MELLERVYLALDRSLPDLPDLLPLAGGGASAQPHREGLVGLAVGNLKRRAVDFIHG